MTPTYPHLHWRRAILVGIMGAGKSTLGPLLADALGWEFLDVDRELARRSGVSVTGWFADRGEAAFRAAEARLTAELSSRDRLVLAPGGGWSATAGSLEGLPARSAVIWLQVGPEEAVRRALAHGERRPLLAGPDPVGAVRSLLAQRTPRYARAHFAIDVGGRSPAELTQEIVAWLKTSIS